ncbi:NAD-dependent epimerase/dehydratase family protein [Desulfogranum mediterraneum]|uniref:NAD-dependent epimerase/dehydratase family protein n=1 Tax=Desulfogranum mediterraneum TaxID=160661 RepID=UPI000417CC3D|nr:NAD-dependent epimerase/dehydratase family protein [Desulfogranum mediterraneum]
METVLVTGGNGFLGSHLVTALMEQGDTVRILARRHGDQAARQGAETIWGDIRDPEAVGRAVAGVDRVIHTVSNFRHGGSDKGEAHSINVEGTRLVLEACELHGVKQLVHCSTIGVHGSVREIPATETTPYNPGDLYQQTKLEAEQEVWRFAEQAGFRTTVIRPISLIGPGDKRMLKLFRMIKQGKFVKIGPCQAFFQPAYIDDVVAGFLLCLGNEQAYGQVFIVGSDEYVPLEELFVIIAEELGVKPPSVRIPLQPVLLLAGLCEALCVPLGIEPPLHRRRVSFFQNNRAFDIAKVKNRLGYQPQVGLREALRRTIAWYEQEGWL